jgi:hypothetical protein
MALCLIAYRGKFTITSRFICNYNRAAIQLFVAQALSSVHLETALADTH